MEPIKTEIPRGRLPGGLKYFPYDFLSGFLVFLIALPLCLGIASACGYPPIAGIFPAIIGGVLTPWLSNSELTIKGPAAGLIVIAIGCIYDFGGNGGIGGWGPADQHAYQIALGVGVAAGVIQILFGLLRVGILGEIFPTSAVHGMLAAIGIIIIIKQLPITLGIMDNKGEPLELLWEMQHKIDHWNPEIALIGLVSLAILFLLPFLKNRLVRLIPAPMVVILIAVPLGLYFDLETKHTYTFGGHVFEVSEEYLVPVPKNMLEAVAYPNFDGLLTWKGWKWVLMFALIGSLESLLSAKAIDMLDPWRRRTNPNRDLLAVGIGNTVVAWVGGLPLISEIVRSKANIDNGARTRYANLYHGLFLLSFVALVPWLIHRIPLAALGAMLVYTGFRLASPREFAAVYKVGREQLVIFTTTIIAVLATDLLIGILIGIAVKFAIHLYNYPPFRALFKTEVEVTEPDDKTILVKVRHAAVFSNWIWLKMLLTNLKPGTEVIVDLSETQLVDHTVMEKLHELEHEFAETNSKLIVRGLEEHRQVSRHPRSARFKVSPKTPPKDHVT